MNDLIKELSDNMELTIKIIGTEVIKAGKLFKEYDKGNYKVSEEDKNKILKKVEKCT